MENLTQAFKELRKQGIFARQNFWCCQTCALADIDNKVDKSKYFGFVFFHNQDNADKVEGHNFYLSYGSTREGEEAQRIGKIIVDTLAKHKVFTSWNGDTDSRIMVIQEIEQGACYV